MNRTIFIIILSTFLLLPITVEGDQSYVEIPVRVLNSDGFVDNLTEKDLIIKEDGIQQKIEAIYLVDGNHIKKRVGKQDIHPTVSRNFILMFHAKTYTAKLGNALEYFFNNVLLPGDQLTLMTPLRPYGFSGAALKSTSKKELIKKANMVLKKDIAIAGANYFINLDDMKDTIIKMGGGKTAKDQNSILGVTGNNIKTNLSKYRLHLENLEKQKTLTEPLLMKCANALKTQKGRNFIYVFYQQEYRPIPNRNVLDTMGQAACMQFDKVELFESERIKETIDTGKTINAISDAAATMHFLFITEKTDPNGDFLMKNHSEDMYNTLSKIARGTNGIVESSATPIAALKKAVGNSKNYYLICYKKNQPQTREKFRKIEVRVKEGNYKILHRPGYY